MGPFQWKTKQNQQKSLCCYLCLAYNKIQMLSCFSSVLSLFFFFLLETIKHHAALLCLQLRRGVGAPHSLHCAEDETHKRAEPPPLCPLLGSGPPGADSGLISPFPLMGYNLSRGLLWVRGVFHLRNPFFPGHRELCCAPRWLLGPVGESRAWITTAQGCCFSWFSSPWVSLGGLGEVGVPMLLAAMGHSAQLWLLGLCCFWGGMVRVWCPLGG